MPDLSLPPTGFTGPPAPALPPAWLRYRDAFAVLQYMCTIAGNRPEVAVPWTRVVSGLGFTPGQGEAVLAYLLNMHCVEYHQGVREAHLTPGAVEYVLEKRGRRRSIRPFTLRH